MSLNSLDIDVVFGGIDFVEKDKKELIIYEKAK